MSKHIDYGPKKAAIQRSNCRANQLWKNAISAEPTAWPLQGEV